MSENNNVTENKQTAENSFDENNLSSSFIELVFEYMIQKELGEGANGKTYLGVSRFTGEKVAIKALKLSQVEDNKGFDLFLREAAVLESVRVPGVPLFYKSIIPKNAAETCFLVQEYIEHPSVLELIGHLGKCPESLTLAVIYKVAQILFSLQTQYMPPIIHRDIKPSNILCSFGMDGSEVDIHDSKNEVYLIDFGAVANPQKQTGGSTVAGTLGYMPPEQLGGEVCVQSDFYSLGATALHMLTGVAPYNIQADVFKLQYESVLEEEAPETSAYMKALLKILLAPEPEKRPENAEKLLQMIHDVINRKMPVLNDESDKQKLAYRGKIGTFFHELGEKIREAQKPAADALVVNWARCKGSIRCFSLIQSDTGVAQNALEYIFTYDDKLWCGVWALKNYQEKGMDIFHNLRFPIPCTVSYNPEDPRMNCLYEFTIKGVNIVCKI